MGAGNDKFSNRKSIRLGKGNPLGIVQEIEI